MITSITADSNIPNIALIERAAVCFGRKLMPDIASECTVDVVLKNKLFKREKIKGEVEIMDDEKPPREFEITLDGSMSTRAIIVALAHEMVHVKQYATGELKNTDKLNVNIWKRKKITIGRNDYWDLPWEVEAYGREIALLEFFVTVNKLKKARWYKDPDYAKA